MPAFAREPDRTPGEDIQPGTAQPPGQGPTPSPGGSPERDHIQLRIGALPGIGGAARVVNDPALQLERSPIGERSYLPCKDSVGRSVGLYATKLAGDRYVLEPASQKFGDPVLRELLVKLPGANSFMEVKDRLTVPPGTIVRVGYAEPFQLPTATGSPVKPPPPIRDMVDLLELKPGMRLSVGRSQECNIIIPAIDAGVSGKHLTIERTSSGLYKVSDGMDGRPSKNGTYYKKGDSWIRLERPIELEPGATIRLGSDGPILTIPAAQAQPKMREFGARRWYGPKAQELADQGKRESGASGPLEARVQIPTMNGRVLATDVPVFGAEGQELARVTEALQAFATSYRERALSHLTEQCRALTRKSRGPERDALLGALETFGRESSYQNRDAVMGKLARVPGLDPSHRALFGEQLSEFQKRLLNPQLLPGGVKSVIVVDKKDMGVFVDSKNRAQGAVKAFDTTLSGDLVISRELLSSWRRWEKSTPRKELLGVLDRIDERQTYLAQHGNEEKVEALCTVMAAEALAGRGATPPPRWPPAARWAF